MGGEEEESALADSEFWGGVDGIDAWVDGVLGDGVGVGGAEGGEGGP